MSEMENAGLQTFEPRPVRPAPSSTTGVIGWMRENLFSTPLNVMMTLGGLWLAYFVVSNFVEWAFVNAVWQADNRRQCLDQVGTAGACWAGVIAWWQNLIYGLYPKDQVWRINAGFLLLVLWVVPLWLDRVRSKVAIGLTAVLVYPFLASYFFLGGERNWLWAVLIAGALACFAWVWLTTLTERMTGATFGQFVLAALSARQLPEQRQRRLLQATAGLGFLLALGAVALWHLPEVGTRQWGGLFLTLVVSGIGIAFSLPAGVVLALGRRSKLPVISLLCTMFIELFRSVPLITVLFMFNTMLPLFLPAGTEVNQLARAIVAVCLFSAAYMAEIVRGGLQAIPRGQYEAAAAMGLSYWQSTQLIILPQALKIMIPAIVGNFIGLFKDTTLVSIIGLFDLLSMARAITDDGNWVGLFFEPFVFVAMIYFVFCFAMSQYSMNLERKLDTGPDSRR